MMTAIQTEYALPATIYRIAEAEKTIKELKNELEFVKTSLSKAIEQIQSKKQVTDEGLCDKPQPLVPNIVVPDELRHCKGKKYIRSGRVVFGKKNRNYEQTAKRWAIWKTQCELGLSMAAIARAWGCDHASILHAKKKGFVPYAKC